MQAEGIDTLSSFHQGDRAIPSWVTCIWRIQFTSTKTSIERGFRAFRRKEEVGGPLHIMLFRVGTFRENPRNPCPDRFDLWCAEGGRERGSCRRLSQDFNSAARGEGGGYILTDQYPLRFRGGFLSFRRGFRSGGGPVGHHDT